MAQDKTGDPRDREQRTGGARFVPAAAGYGTEAIVPAPLNSGPPRPEPEERWTLGFRQHPGQPPEGGAEGDRAVVPAEPDEDDGKPQTGEAR